MPLKAKIIFKKLRRKGNGSKKSYQKRSEKTDEAKP